MVRTMCKNNRYFDDAFLDGGLVKTFNHLVVGEYYDLEYQKEEMMYILPGGYGDGYVFFGVSPAFEKYDFKRFFYSKEEMRNININKLLC